MYKNRMRSTTSKGHPKFCIRRSEIPFDERRVRYIESVCQVLIESRFGPGRVEPVVINFSDRPELEPAVFYDLCDEDSNELAPFYALSPQGRNRYQVVEAAYRRTKQMTLLNTGPNAPNVRNSIAALTPNQGRGSP